MHFWLSSVLSWGCHKWTFCIPNSLCRAASLIREFLCFLNPSKTWSAHIILGWCFLCLLFPVPYLGTAVLLCLDLFLKMVVLHSTGIAGWCEFLGVLLPARLFAFAGSVYFPGSCMYYFVFLASYLCSDVAFDLLKILAFFSAGFACLLGDLDLVLLGFMSYSVLASKCK